MNGYRILGIFIVAFFLERACWMALGVFTTSFRRFLNLPSLFDELLRIANYSFIGLFQLFFWLIVINFAFSHPLTSFSFTLSKNSFYYSFLGFFITTLFLLILFIIELFFNILVINSIIVDNISLLDFFIIVLRSFTITFWFALIEELVYR